MSPIPHGIGQLSVRLIQNSKQESQRVKFLHRVIKYANTYPSSKWVLKMALLSIEEK